MTGKICGTGSWAPDRVWDNNDLAKMVETSDQWIRERTGVVQRHIAKEDEDTVTMAAGAALRALEDAEMKAEEIDLILVATISPTESLSFLIVTSLLHEFYQKSTYFYTILQLSRQPCTVYHLLQ